jgi:EF hand
MVRQLFTATLLAALAAAPCFADSAGERAAFLTAGRNGDKQIDRKEFRVLIDEMAAIGAEKAISVRKWGVYGMGFGRADANGDGVISIPELKAQK